MENIKTNKGQLIKVSKKHFEELSKHIWYIEANGYAVNTKCIRSRKESREKCLPRQISIKMHRFIYELEYGVNLEKHEHIDHINQNKIDNRIENLRLSCLGSSINQINVGLRADNTSGYKGVVWRERNKKWEAKISYKGKRIWIGSFENKEIAGIKYNEKALELFGEACYLNVIKTE